MKYLPNFWKTYKQELLPRLKNTCFVWDYIQKDSHKNRTYPKCELVRYRRGNYDLILFVPIVDNNRNLGSDILLGHPIYNVVNDTFNPFCNYSDEDEDDNTFKCNVCGKQMINTGLHCDKCNYDLCAECMNKTTHKHRMILIDEYFGSNTYEIIYCKERLKIKLE